MNQKNSQRKCPQCSGPIERDSKNFPFCSERCQMLDLGAWATERYRIAAVENDEGISSEIEDAFEIEH